MNRLIKKALAGVVSSSLLMTFMPLAPVHAYESQGDFVFQDMGDGSVKITGYKGNDPIVTIPESLDGRPVSVIASMAFDADSIKEYYINADQVAIEEYGIGASYLPDSTEGGCYTEQYRKGIIIHAHKGSSAEAFLVKVNNTYYHQRDFKPQKYTNPDGRSGTYMPNIPSDAVIWDDSEDWKFVPVDQGTRETAESVRQPGAKQIEATGVTLNEKEVTLKTGSQLVLAATIAPENASDRTVKWMTNNPSVISIDTTGRVTALATGVAMVKAVIADGKYSDTCVIRVR